MLPKYTVDYAVEIHRHVSSFTYSTDDPVTCEEFLVELLERGFRIKAIRHEGVELPMKESDRLVKNAVNMLAAKKVCAALGLKPEEERFRFGFAA